MFVELCARTNFSFLEGASHPEEMIIRAKELGYDALGVVDRDGIYGLVRAHREAKERGVRLISGAELTIAYANVDTFARADGEGELPSWEPGLPLRVMLLLRNHTGYRNLCALLTKSHAPYEKGTARLDLRDLANHAEGIDLCIGADDELVSAFIAGDRPRRAAFPRPLQEALESFGGRTHIVAHRALDGMDPARTALATWLADELDARPFASMRPLFHCASRRVLSDVVACIRRKVTLDEAGRSLLGNAEARLRTEDQMLALFRDQKAWVHRSGEVASGLTFSFSELRYHFPCEAHCEPGESPDEALRRLTYRGLLERYAQPTWDGTPVSVVAQCEKELTLIAKLGVAPYFLSVYEVIQMAKRRRILCQGRGSAANSAVCYALSITAVDPARSNLLFERFLSAERAEPPDIDVDFEHERREEVIQEIYSTYGRDRAAMVCEVIAYRGRSALREVGKVFGLGMDQLDQLTSMVLRYDLADITEPLVRELGLDPKDERLLKVIQVAKLLEGAPRHLGVHVGGFILSAEPLDWVAPVEPARMEGRTVIPWDKDDIDTLGFFKLDVLGLGMLTCVRKSLAYLHALGLDADIGPREDEVFDPLAVVTRIPPEDPATYEAIGHADTVGVFQIESRAQMSMLPRLKPVCFYDLVIEVAIVRPGPIQGGMVHPYLRRRQGLEPSDPPHPCLAPILERTLGVPLFQEQVMQIAMVGASYTAGEADQLRRDMAAWKKHGRLERHREKLLAGFAAQGIAEDFGEALYKQIQGFGEYGFPESHAASFALIVYASAWLKTHHPGVFACGLLNSQPMGFYSPSSIVQDAQRHGVEVRSPCITKSDWDSTMEPSVSSYDELALRLGLRQIAGIGEAPARAIVSARAEAPFPSMGDLTRRAGLARRELVLLAEAGALEKLEPGRRNAMWRAFAPKLPSLFADVDLEAKAEGPNLPTLRKLDQLLLDYGRLGLSVDDHPMNHVRGELERQWRAREIPSRVLRHEELAHLGHGQRVAIAGLIIGRQRPMTASGVTFISLEDETGVQNLIVTVPVFERFRHAVLFSKLALVRGTLEREGEVLHVLVDHLERLELTGRLAAGPEPQTGVPTQERVELPTKSRDFH